MSRPRQIAMVSVSILMFVGMLGMVVAVDLDGYQGGRRAGPVFGMDFTPSHGSLDRSGELDAFGVPADSSTALLQLRQDSLIAESASAGASDNLQSSYDLATTLGSVESGPAEWRR